jgi:hypothetical protein
MINVPSTNTFWLFQNGIFDVDFQTIDDIAENFARCGAKYAMPVIWQQNYGALGWDPVTTTQTQTAIPTDALTQYRVAMAAYGIKTIGSFRVCLTDGTTETIGTNVPFISAGEVSGWNWADVFDTDFQHWISSVVSEVAPYVDGINLDYIRTAVDAPQGEDNKTAIKAIVTKVREKAPNTLITTTAKPYLDLSTTQGRDSITWLNEDLVDVVFSMEYGYEDGDYGDPPNMTRVADAQALVTKPYRIICMGSNYWKNDTVNTPSSGIRMQRVINAMRNDPYNNSSLFSYVYFNRDQEFRMRMLTNPTYALPRSPRD